MLPIVRPVSFVEMFPNVSAEALNFLSQCLCYNPKRGNRCSVIDGLRHPLVAEFHDADDEPSSTKICLGLNDKQLFRAIEYQRAICDAVSKRKLAARKLERALMANPARTILMENEETLPAPF